MQLEVCNRSNVQEHAEKNKKIIAVKTQAWEEQIRISKRNTRKRSQQSHVAGNQLHNRNTLTV